MKTTMSEVEVNRVPADAVSHALSKLPFNAQDENDKLFAEHFLLKGIASKVNSRLKKIEDKVKEDFKSNTSTDAVTLTKNYRREITEGSPRMLFDPEMFIAAIRAKFPEIMAHQLREMLPDCKAPSANPLSITLEYIGDIPGKELP